LINNTVDIAMKQTLFLLFIGSILFSCKEDELPARGVYGEPGSAMVFNLKLIDPEIENKTVTASGNKHGKARIVGNGNYLIYESDLDFTSDVVTVSANGNQIGTVRFLADNLDNSCQTFAKSYEFTFKKSMLPVSVTLSKPKNCGNTAYNNPILYTNSFNEIAGLDFGLASGSLLLIFNPPHDFIGTGETVYDLGYNSSGALTNTDINKLALLVSGLVRITVEE